MAESSGQAALALASHGYAIFPCKPRDKQPLIRGGVLEASREEAKVAAWWRQFPNANIGVAAGASGIVVLDIDSKAGADPDTIIGELGLENHPAVIRTGAAPPPSAKHPNSLEGVRGAQLWFRQGDRKVSTATRLQGVEFRRDKQYGIAPPSIHPSGVAYEGNVLPVAELPELPDAVADLADRQAGEPAPPIGDTIPHGEQHRTLVSLGGSMRNRGMEESEIEAALWEVNKNRCEVPAPREHITKIAKSLMAYEPGDPVIEPEDITPVAPDPDDAGPLIVFAGELGDLQLPDTASWFENALLPIAGLLVMHGPAKSFKSFAALDLLASVAQGLPWCHFEPTEEPAKVCVVQFEIPPAYYRERIDFLRLAAPEAQLFDEHFGTYTPLTRPRLVAGDKKTEDPILTALVAADIQVVMIDPIRRGMGFASMNDENEVRKMLAFFERMNDEGITVVACHHDNKANFRGGEMEAMTGSGAFGGDPDTVVGISVPRRMKRESPFRNVGFDFRNAPPVSLRSFQMTEEGVLRYSTEPINPEDPDEEAGALPDF